MLRIVSICLLSVGTFLPLNAAAQQVPAVITKTLDLWSPKSITAKDKAMYVVLPQRRMTDDIYYAAINATCSTLWEDKNAWGTFAPNEIYVLNEYGAAGFVLEGDVKAVCVEAAALPPKLTRLHYSGNTRTHADLSRALPD